ncbi:MAG: hypothetical protein HDS11_07375 [Bacteroides sp.]|nr:hypothetical protein [Bacteroidales bacterium]MBD5317470.1 hypothetical protein [Bacteroides sp.]
MFRNDDPDDILPDHFTNEPDTSAGPQAVHDPDDPFAPVAPDEDPAPAPRHRFRKFVTVLILLVFIVLGCTVWIRYFHPYADDAQTTGYVVNMERRGILFKTYEGNLITHENLTDTMTVYQRDFNFSVPDDSLARLIQAYQASGIPVTLTFERYYATLPWRGASKCIVTALSAPSPAPAKNGL